ncbi:MAG: zinc finger domain-containing protein [Candidatus Woesearchaeota archaeon]
MNHCSSCKKSITNSRGSVVFKCPQCKKTDIVRCKHCRQTVVKYACPECGFVGPN